MSYTVISTPESASARSRGKHQHGHRLQAAQGEEIVHVDADIQKVGKKFRLSGTGHWPLFPTVVLAALVFAALFAPYLAPHNPREGNIARKSIPPIWMERGDWEHPLGTDRFGRDVLSRIIYGTRISLAVSLIAIGVAGTVGTAVGLISGYRGGAVDAVLMRLTDIGLSLPTILIAVVLVAVSEPSFRNVVFVIALLLWPRFARQIRGETLAIKEQEYVALAIVAGRSSSWIISRHIFPNVVPTLLVVCTLQVGYVVLLEGSLSFLGVGVPPPNPAWGLMIADGRGFLATAWWISLFPGLAMLLTVLAVNLLGDWLRDRLDPKLRQV